MRNDHQVLDRYLGKFQQELFSNVLPFWMKHSPDRKYGGYFNCLDRDGRRYDDKKFMWLQGRQVWMFSKLYNTVEQKPAWLDLAALGADFIRRHGRSKSGRVYFSLTREGRPYGLQRKIFSECFYVMGLSEYARASGDRTASREALELFWKIHGWTRDSRELGRPRLAGQEKVSQLADPMIVLNLIEELRTPDNARELDRISAECVRRIRQHVRPKLRLVLENVGADGKQLDSFEGRLVNPGHAIEAGWFLLDYALKRGQPGLIPLAQQMVDWSFDAGWDRRCGGIYYFLDAGGHDPIQLEWPMKLWWPHAEAMVAFLLLYQVTGERRYLDRFRLVTDYTFRHFPDPRHGEWFGYLDREGRPTHRFKGGPYKGCFHIPRALMMCIRILKEMCSDRRNILK